MSNNERVRFMRLIVFFDLPVGTYQQRKNYRVFRKQLLKEGYIMMQESVYSKIAINEHAALSSVDRLKRIRPPEGIVEVLRVTEKQYASIVYITGSESPSEVLASADALVVL